MSCCTLIQPLTHHSSHLELHRAFSWDMNSFQGLRILCGSGVTCPWLKDTEVPKLQAVVQGKLYGDLIQKVLDHRLNRSLSRARSRGDPVDQIFF